LLALASFWLVVSWNPINANGWNYHTQNDHSIGFTILSIGWVSLAFITSILLFRRNATLESRTLYHTFYLDRAFETVVGIPTVAVGSFIENFDRKVIDRFIHFVAYVQVTLAYFVGWWDKAIVDGVVNGSSSAVRLAGSFTRSFQSGKIQLYIFWAAFAIIIFLIWSLI
jgi:NADH-quinone oxidoreductase subunit L